MDELVAKLENLYDDLFLKDQLQKRMTYRYGKRMTYRYGKRAAMPYRFGKRGSDIDDEYETELDDKQKRLTYRYGK